MLISVYLHRPTEFIENVYLIGIWAFLYATQNNSICGSCYIQMIYIFCPSIGYILDCDSAFQPQVATARADRQTNRPRRLAPPLLHHVPYREVVPRHGDRDRRLLPGRQLDIREPLEYGGRLPSGRGEVDVQLRDLSQVQVG